VDTQLRLADEPLQERRLRDQATIVVQRATHHEAQSVRVAARRIGLGRVTVPFVERGRVVGRDDVDLGALLDGLGREWETPQIAYKPYPACHYVHAALDATIAAVTDEGLRAQDIEEIVVLSPPAGVSLVLEPAAGKARPRSEYEAKFSLPYAVGSYLRHGRVDVTSFTESAIGDEEVLALAARVSYEVKDFETAGSAFPGGARVRTGDGRVIERELLYQRGDPHNPVSAEDVRAKWRANATTALAAGEAEALEAALLGLEHQPDLTAVRALAAADARVAA